MNEQEAIKYLEQHGYIADDAKDMAINMEKQTFKIKNILGGADHGKG